MKLVYIDNGENDFSLFTETRFQSASNKDRIQDDIKNDFSLNNQFNHFQNIYFFSALELLDILLQKAYGQFVFWHTSLQVKVNSSL